MCMSTIGKSVVPPGGPSGDPPPIIDGSHDGSPGPMERSSPIQVSLDGTGTADGVVTVGSMIGDSSLATKLLRLPLSAPHRNSSAMMTWLLPIRWSQ